MVNYVNRRLFKLMPWVIVCFGITICHQRAFAQVAAGSYHSCAVNSFTGKVYCWGRNVEGQLGDGTNIDRPTPVDITNKFANPIIQISAGDTTTCAVDSTRHVFCWGRGSEGELGNGSNLGSNTPVQVLNIDNARYIGVGAYTICALRTDDSVFCWGLGLDGELGNGANANSNVPVEVYPPTYGRNWEYLVLGGAHACGIYRHPIFGSVVRCWGANGRGELGDGTIISRNVPVAIRNATNGDGTSLTNPISIGAGFEFTCMAAGGELFNRTYCWGRNDTGQLADGGTTDSHIPKPLNCAAPDVSPCAGGLGSGALSKHMCSARGSDGAMVCWGADVSGQVLAGVTSARITPRDALVHHLLNQQLHNTGGFALGMAHTIVVDHSDPNSFFQGVMVGGDNTYHQLGDGTTTSTNVAHGPVSFP